MALFKSVQAANRAPAISPDGAAEGYAIISDFIVPAGLAANDIVEMTAIPAGTIVTDANLYVEDTDSNGTPTIVLAAGLLSGEYLSNTGSSTCGSELFSGLTTAQAGGLARLTLTTLPLGAPSMSDRAVGIKVTTGAATLVVGAKWRLVLFVTPTPIGLSPV